LFCGVPIADAVFAGTILCDVHDLEAAIETWDIGHCSCSHVLTGHTACVGLPCTGDGVQVSASAGDFVRLFVLARVRARALLEAKKSL